VKAALALAAWLAALAAVAAADPALDYQLHCQGCHLEDGSGAPAAVPSLVGVGRFLATSRGREYLVRVPGSAQAPLSSERLAALLDWLVRRFPDAGAPEPARFDPAQVERWRRQPLTDVATLRAALLAELRPSASGAAPAASARPR
jgi:mono/diheme cytochrome c family protein